MSEISFGAQGMRTARAQDCRSKSVKHSPNLCSLTMELVRDVGIDESDIIRDNEMVLQLVEAPDCVPDKLRIGPIGSTPRAFRKIRTDRHARPACLRHEPKTLVGWPPTRLLVHASNELARPLPHLEFAVVPHVTSNTPFRRSGEPICAQQRGSRGLTGNWQLVTGNPPKELT